MSDAFEDQARALAWNTRPGDITSESSIRAIAIGLRETWRVATEAAEAKAALLEHTIQNGAEMIRSAHARAEAAEAERDRLAAELKEIGLEPFQRKGSKRVIGSEEITPPALSSTTEAQP